MKWLQLDTDMPHDPKIRAVTRVMGVSGLGALVGVWCHVGRHGVVPGGAVDHSGRPLPLEDLRDAAQLDRDQFDQLIAICVGSGHFDREQWQRDRGIWIPAMARRADTYTRRIQQKKQLDFQQQW